MKSDELISRLEAIDVVRSMTISLGGKEIFHPEVKKSVLGVLDDLPTIDAEPVRHGQWIEYTHWIGAFGQIYSKCSECGTTYSGRKGSRGDGKGGKFCEECGTKMDLEVRDDG